MEEPMDPTFAALEPQLRELRRAQATDTGMAVARGLAGEMPSRPDYTQERIQLIGMLDNIVGLQQKIDAEREKTGRVRLSTMSTLMRTLGGVMEAELGAQGTVAAARIKANADRLDQLDRRLQKDGPRDASALGAAASQKINELGALAKDGAIDPGNAAAFATTFQDGFNQIDRVANPDLARVYVDTVQAQTGVDVSKWLRGEVPTTNNTALPRLSSTLDADLARGDAAYGARLRAAEDIYSEVDQVKNAIRSGGPSVNEGSALARGMNAVIRGLDEAAGLAGPDTTVETTAAEPPAATATKAEKDAFLATVNPLLSTDATGANVIMRPPTAAAKPGAPAPAPAEPQVLGAYKDVAPTIAPKAGARSSTGLVAYLDEQRDYVLKELDRLENASDLESVRLRSNILAGPELAAWAAENGYESYTPEQQLKAAFAMKRANTVSRDKAFRAQLDTDILAQRGKAGAIRTAGAAIRTGLRELPGAVAGAVGKAGRAAADLVGGAIRPGDRTAEAGITEAEPTVEEAAAPGAEAPARTAIEAGGIEAATGEAGQKAEEASLLAELAAAEEMPESTRLATERATGVEFGRQRGLAEATIGRVAFADMMAPTAEGQALRARLARQIGGRAATEDTLTEAQREELKRRYAAAGGPLQKDPRFADVRAKYEELQALKATEPTKYAAELAKLAQRVNLELRPPVAFTVAGEGADLGAATVTEVSRPRVGGGTVRPAPPPAPAPALAPPEPKRAPGAADLDVDIEPDVEVPEAEDVEAPVGTPDEDAPVLGDETPEPEPGLPTPAAPMEEPMPEAPAGGGGFLQKFKQQKSGPRGGTAAEAAAAQGQGQSGMPQAAPSAPIAFQSFGAEAATDAAMQAQMRRRQLEAERARRLGLMRADMA